MKILLITTLLLAAVSAVPIVRDNITIIRNDISDNYRLPNNSVPISYKINLIPYIVEDNFTFDGESTIELRVLEPSSSITLHILNLTIVESATTLVSSANTSYEVTNHVYDTTREFLFLKFANNLPTGNYTLYLQYVGILNDNIFHGFYISSYINDDGETVWLATTQFEATSAREAFPCWDDPALKATFIISIKHDANYTALSNMPVASQSVIDTTDNKLWTTFEETPIMSTYLVAFVVSDYGYVSKDNGTFRVWARKNALHNAAYALTMGESLLACLEEYTSIPYALPKIDQISIPDFSSGAMENWGLVTYREKSLLYDANMTTTLQKQHIATVISHEFAHQWFGNLVSPYWWKYLWLNEGFAAYFEYYITNEATDNWRMMEQFVIRKVQAIAFLIDSANITHPMNQDVSTPEEIDVLFDRICYSKGASVIHMMSSFLTPAVLRAGLVKYIKNHAYGVATPDDLWSALQEVSDENGILQNYVSVKTVMDTWVDQPGYPVVTVTRNYTTNTAIISQERFFESGASDDGTRWWIPITYTTQLNPDFSSTLPSEWMIQEDDSIVISGLESTDWVIFNLQQSGYYRVNYDETNWKLIADYLNTDNYVNIHLLNRAQLIHDSYYLARANRISYSIFLDISAYLRRETDYIVWYPMMNAIHHLLTELVNTESYTLFKRHILELLENSVATLGYDERDDDEHVEKLYRGQAIGLACILDSEKCKSNATARLVAHLENPIANPLSPDLIEWTFCAGLKSANATVWNKVLDLFIESHSTIILKYLGCSQDKEILETYLTLATRNNTSILNDHAFAVYASIYNASPENINFFLDYFINNFETLYTFWNASEDTIERVIPYLTLRLTRREQINKLHALIKEQSEVLGFIETYAINSAKRKIKWTEIYEAVFREWLYNFYGVEDEKISSAAIATADPTPPPSSNFIL